jgi:hypothetical protein
MYIILININNIMEKTYKWVPKSRGDEIPVNAIYAGTTRTDGHVYVGRFRNIPGKVNLDKGKIYNFWVQALGSQRDGEVLTTTNSYKWVDIRRNDEIPKNAVYTGLDQSNDKVWVGRSKSGEPGKINCTNNKSTIPLMCNLWCHSKSSAEQVAHILVIEENDEIVKNDDETEEEQNEEIKKKHKKLEYLHCHKEEKEELPLWTHCKVNKISKTVKSNEIEVSIGNIAKTLFDVLSAVDGNIISLIDLIKTVKLHLESSSSEELITSKELIITKPNEKGFKKYIILIFSKQDITKTKKWIGVFTTNKSYIDIKIDYTILEPNNNAAQLKCQELINEKTNMMIESFRPREKKH